MWAKLAACGLFIAMAPGASAQVVINNGPITQFTPTVSTLTTGTVLDAGASISADGRYVTLNTHISQSSLNGIDTFGSAGPGLGQQFLIDVRGRAVGTARMPYRPAEVGRVTLVENDKALLMRMVPEITAESISLRAAVRQLGVVSGANIAVGWKAIRDANIDELKPRRLQIPAGTLKETLLEFLKQTVPQESMVITSEDNVVFITTQAQADNTVVTKWYYTADLLANAPRWMPHLTDLGQVGRKATGATSAPPSRLSAATQPSLFATPQPEVAPPKPASPSTSIAELITSTVRPEIWKCNGGKVGEISEVRDRVLITAPQSVHALLDGPRHYDPNAVQKYVGGR
jgi:hypothetical protein